MNWQNRIEKWAEDRNLIDGSNAKCQLKKLLEEVGELATAVAIGDTEGAKDGIGDACVVLAIMARQLGLGLNVCQEQAWEEIKDRRGRMIDGVFVKEEGLAAFETCGDCKTERHCEMAEECQN